MESLTIGYQATLKCLESLHDSLEVIADPKFVLAYERLRDSVIQRFEYTIDIFLLEIFKRMSCKELIRLSQHDACKLKK